MWNRHEPINKGDRVSWIIGNGVVKGEVIDLYHHKPVPELKRSLLKDRHDEVVRALLIKLEDGRKVLKLEDEVLRDDNS